MQKKPTFFWQGLMILLPFALLLAFGVYSLRQDKALAEAEAKERAQRYADELEHKIEALLAAASDPLSKGATDSTEAPTFTVSADGDLLTPPAIATLVPSPLDLKQLNPVQARQWLVATQSEFTTNRDETVRAYREFLASRPPEEFHDRASYSLALALGDSEAAREAWSALTQATNAVSDAGFPLPLLVRLKLAELAFTSTMEPTAKDYDSLNKLCGDAIAHPTILTPFILNFAEKMQSMPHDSGVLVARPTFSVEKFQTRWAADETARTLYVAARKQIDFPQGVAMAPFGTHPPHLFWIGGETPYLAIADQQLVTRVTCIPQSEIQKRIDDILKTASYIPDYFGLTVDIAGRELTRLNATSWHETSHFSPRSPGGVDEKVYSESSPTPVLATAFGTDANPANLKVDVVLTNKAALFKQQQTRMIWFMCVIVASGAVGGTGLWRSWRTFLRQQQLNEMKSNFVSSVSHELRAPIASVRLLAEALDRGAVSEQPKQKEYFRFIVQECRRLTGLIENVLDFSRIDQGRKQYQFDETDLTALVDQTIKLMQPAANERGVAIQLRIADCGLQIVCDGLALQQALVNLIDNAVKHSSSGESIEVELNEIRNPQSAIRNAITLSVIDHGPGIPAEDHQKIFERFYRRGSELRRETQGIGIGLTIVKHVAEAHGGRVMVESAIGKGSKFTIELPTEPRRDEKARNPKSEIRNKFE